MIAITVDTRRAVVAERELLTTGSAGIPVKFTFSSDWDGLSIFAIFRNAEDMDSRVTVVVPESGAVSLPSECCATEYMGEPVYAGVYGTDGYGNTVIPTVWVSIGELREGASYEGAPGTANPTPDMWAQMEALALSTGAANVELAEAAQEAAEAAQAGAEAAQTAAETAQTAAETAQGLAETAQSGAEIAQSAAEIAQAGAETAQTAAETAQGKAEDAQTGAEAAQAAAEAAQAAAEEAAASVNIDTEMSTTSEHAVQNKVITAALGGKVDKVSGKQLSTEDYTSAEKTKLAGIAAGAEVNVQADWTQTSTTADDYIKNKPANLVQDASYVHTDNNYTTADKTKLAGIPADADKTVIDDTLTQAGEAADAKATGDAIATINSALSSLQSVTEIIDTASGAIASFPDGSGLPMRSLVAEINPVQDLHGYDAPYPAGGGVNKLYQPAVSSQTINGVTWTVNADGSITVNGTASGVSTFNYINDSNGIGFSFDGDYKYKNFPSVSYLIMGCGVLIDSTWKTIYPNTYSDLADIHGQIKQMWFQIKDGQTANNITIYPLICSASETEPTAWTPYANICPISGWTGLEGQRTGANLFDKTTAVVGYIDDADGELKGTQAGSAYRSTDFVRVDGGKSYYIKTEQTASIWGAWYDENKAFIRGQTNYANAVITAPNNAKYVRLTAVSSNNGNLDTFAVNYPSTDTSYHSYTGEAISVSWQDEAGTVYKGTVDSVTGVLIATHKMVTLVGANTEAWGNTYSTAYGAFSITLSDANINGIPSQQLLSNQFVGHEARGAMQSWSVGKLLTYNQVADNKYVFFTTDITDKTQWLAWLANNPTQLLYPLAEQQTYQLTPQEVDTLVGQNNVFVDTGSVSVEYPADTKLYIDKRIAELAP